MAKQNTKQSKNITKSATGKTTTVPKSPSTKPTIKPQETKSSFVSKYAHLLFPISIAIVTFLFLQTCLNNQFTNWDDPGYVTQSNQYIKNLSFDGLKDIFTYSVMGNYHPLTILTYAIEYSFVRLEPWLYHLDSLLFHIATTILVYWLILKLTKQHLIAFITALLFGLHPMHVESIAWIAGRKDVVYGMFYIASCIAYIYYIRAENKKNKSYYALCLFLFICSLLAKPVAVVLPISLLLFDYFDKRFFIISLNKDIQSTTQVINTNQVKFNLNVLYEKIPFFLLAFGAGIKSLMDQHQFKALNTMDVSFAFYERFALGNYALITYLWKALVPIGLCNLYPYPEIKDNMLPIIYYSFIAAVLLIVFLVVYFARKNRFIVFGCLFFLVNIVLLLQFLPVGGAIVADRYSYLPYLGLFFIIAYAVSYLFQSKKHPFLGKIAVAVTIIYCGILGYLSNERCQVWYDTVSLWRDEVVKQPLAPSAFNNLGFEYFNRGNNTPDPKIKKLYFDSAVYLSNEAIRLKSTFVNPYITLGEVARSCGNWAEAKKQYYHSFKLSGAGDETYNGYLGLAIVYCITGNLDSGKICFQLALTQKPFFPEAHSNFGNFYDMTGKPDSALKEYGIAIQQNPDMYAPHLNRGRLLDRLNKMDAAINDLNIAAALNTTNGETYYALARCYVKTGNKQLAITNLNLAKKYGFNQFEPAIIQALSK